MTYGIGVVGVGVWGCHSLEHMLLKCGDARVVAVSTDESLGAHCFPEPVAERGSAYAKELKAEFRADWREVVADPRVHIVSAMACPTQKAQVILAALRAGKHVVTDKPLAFTVEEARAVCDAETASTGRGFMLAGYHRRPLVARLIEVARVGRLGQIKAVSMRLCFMGGVYPGFVPTTQWRAEVPSAELTTIGSHALVTLMRLLPELPVRVNAMVRNCFYESYRAVGAEDWAELNLQYGSGAVANVTVARLPHKVPGEDILLEVTGTDGYADITGTRLSVYPGPEVVDLAVDGAAVNDETFKAFYRAIETGAAAPTTFAEGQKLQALLDAALQSARTRTVAAVGAV
ncbi:MAG: hypothetical protein A3K19_16245 [Lentisphaerae bacterium RIFOXYB12_FULL_65_16]|nr:MAG: hypothetical protein A3K18_11745 [Lentisphaerae bacterium RIFOXYA12_64_32]OGV90176.1 MAG: hypothetical protein A3K19_16245 [Lentisphaerae bacterium RIFOXYB12_FULL_65_16]